MRYKEFWWAGQKMFGGKFTRFMSGLRGSNCMKSGEQSVEHFNPSDTKNNFAVPSQTTLKYFCPIQNGIISKSHESTSGDGE